MKPIKINGISCPACAGRMIHVTDDSGDPNVACTICQKRIKLACRHTDNSFVYLQTQEHSESDTVIDDEVTYTMMLKARIEKALDYAVCYGQIDGEHHKTWVIDQIVRALTGCPMEAVEAIDCNGKTYTYERQGTCDEYVEAIEEDEDDPWDIGIAP